MKNTHEAIVNRWLETLDHTSKELDFTPIRTRIDFWDEVAAAVKRHAVLQRVKTAVTKQHQEEISAIAADVRREARTITNNKVEVIDEIASVA
jgi:hypothetical protein